MAIEIQRSASAVMWTLKFSPRSCVQALARLVRGLKGEVAVIFALSLIPILAFVGAAVDFSRASSVKADMQAALDTTALMISKRAASLSGTELETSAQEYFLAMLDRPEAKNVTVTASYSTSGGSSVALSASANIETDFISILGYKTIAIGATSIAKWGSARLRVALVLDTTGSMADDGKIAALKTATKNLLTQLQGAVSTDGDVYVSIIPFSKNVNVGAGNYNASWIDWSGWEAEPDNLRTSKPNNWDRFGPGSNCPFTGSSHGYRCTTGPRNGSPTTSTIPSSGTYSGYICPGVDSGSKDERKIGIYYNGCYNSVPTTTTTVNQVCSGRYCSCGNLDKCSCTGSGYSKVCRQTVTTVGPPYTHDWIKNDHSTWNGCISDRGTSSGPSQEYDRLVTPPTTNIPATLFPAEQNSYCSPAIMGLNANWTAMASAVDSLYPNGATNQPIGLVWGWQSLVGGGPLTAPPKDSNDTYSDVIILLSDGLNTQNRWYGDGSHTSASVDARMYDAGGNGTCANIKAVGIIVYTIQVNTGGDKTSTLLKNCASTPDKFFLLTSANQIITTFDTIGTNLTRLRIAH